MDPLPEPPTAAILPALTIPEEGELEGEDTAEQEELSDRIKASRRVTEPLPSAITQVQIGEQHGQPRNLSPYSRTRFRGTPSTNASAAPPMTRTRSLPTVNLQYMSRSPSHSPVRPSSPFRSAPTPTRGNLHRPFDESYPHSGGGSMQSFMDIQSIDEDQELDIHSPDRDFQGSLSMQVPTHGHTFPRSAQRRRPASPLHSQAYTGPFSHPSSPMSTLARPSSAHSLQSNTVMSPSTSTSARFNEPYPTAQFLFSTGSSMPSTPTSFRSRSPSISSLETIPDSPDAEEAAVEAFNMEQIKAAAEAAETSDSDSESGRRRPGSLEVPAGSWKGRGGNQRKRWSVCGAERRGDFEMETIWEDGS